MKQLDSGQSSKNASWDDDADMIAETLSEHREARRRIEELGPATLSPWLVAMMWGLRIYVVFMLAVVAFSILHKG